MQGLRIFLTITEFEQAQNWPAHCWSLTCSWFWDCLKIKFLTNFLHCQLIFSLGYCLWVWEGARTFSHLFWEGRQPIPKLLFSFLKGMWASNSCGHAIAVHSLFHLKSFKFMWERNFLNGVLLADLWTAKIWSFNRKSMLPLKYLLVHAA